MNKSLFLNQLRIQLRGIPSGEIDEIIEDYESYFEEAKLNGLSEEEAAANLGNPYEIAKDIQKSYQGQSFQDQPNSQSFRNAIVIIGLVMFNISFVVGPVIGLMGIFFGSFVMCGTFIVSPILAVGKLLLGSGHPFEFFISLGLAGIGLLLLPYINKLFKEAIRLLKRYVQWNLRLVRGEVG